MNKPFVVSGYFCVGSTHYWNESVVIASSIEEAKSLTEKYYTDNYNISLTVEATQELSLDKPVVALNQVEAM